MPLGNGSWLRRTIFVLGMLSCISTEGIAEDRDACLARDGAPSVEACSRLIESHQLTGQDLATIYVVRATMYRKETDYDRAIGDMSHAIELLKNATSNPILSSAYVTRASIYALKRDLTNALSDYRTALALDSSNAQAADGVKQTEAELAASSPAAQTPEPPSKAEEEHVGHVSEFDCCLAYYRGEVSLEGWGAAKRCHVNMQYPQTKNKFCTWLRQFYPGRYRALVH